MTCRVNIKHARSVSIAIASWKDLKTTSQTAAFKNNVCNRLTDSLWIIVIYYALLIKLCFQWVFNKRKTLPLPRDNFRKSMSMKLKDFKKVKNYALFSTALG